MRSVVSCLALALIAVATGCGSAPPTGNAPSAPASTPAPTRDASVVSYGSMVNADVGVLNQDFYKKFTCKTRELCVSELQDMRAAASALLRDLTNTPAPDALSERVASLKAATQQFIDRVDAAVLAIQQPGSDYVHASDGLDLHALNMVAGAVVCWPGGPTPHESGESGSGYVCG